jgi:hypothetical protein
MNIFFLHQTPIIAAQQHADVHIGKMLLESCQLLATAHHQLGNGDAVTYKQTHFNHPCAIWVRSSKLHYQYVAKLAYYLAQEYRNRFRKEHACEAILRSELITVPPTLTKCIWTNPPLAMPDEFKTDDTVESYQRYYASKADKMKMVWNGSEENSPFWFVTERNNYLHKKGLYVNKLANTEQVSI